ncbi:MAG: hypothetical protein HC903_10750 [Methylacidiphilales bacterium]|nr:hypothetical protein [Candidatus Methylacidiphilales bacterium]
MPLPIKYNNGIRTATPLLVCQFDFDGYVYIHNPVETAKLPRNFATGILPCGKISRIFCPRSLLAYLQKPLRVYPEGSFVDGNRPHKLLFGTFA